MGSGAFRFYMKQKYVRALHRAGARVMWIEQSMDRKKLREASALCDGLLLPGGGDIEPTYYGQNRHPATGEPNVLRDFMEPLLFREFLDKEKPILGICRGIQVINVAQGGTLLQDIREEENYPHSDFPHRSSYTHPVVIKNDTLLAKCLKFDHVEITPSGHQLEILVNSMHHQVIEKPGRGVIVNAISKDGFIEGIELEHYPFCLGVQWHPEHMVPQNSMQRLLFQSFVEASKKA